MDRSEVNFAERFGGMTFGEVFAILAEEFKGFDKEEAKFKEMLSYVEDIYAMAGVPFDLSSYWGEHVAKGEYPVFEDSVVERFRLPQTVNLDNIDDLIAKYSEAESRFSRLVDKVSLINTRRDGGGNFRSQDISRLHQRISEAPVLTLQMSDNEEDDFL